MRIARPDLDPADVSAALANSPCLVDGLPLSDHHVLLYAIGSESSFRDCFTHAGAMAKVLGEGITIALVCQSDYPEALEEFGLDHWDQIVYLADRRLVLSWPIGVELHDGDAPMA